MFVKISSLSRFIINYILALIFLLGQQIQNYLLSEPLQKILSIPALGDSVGNWVFNRPGLPYNNKKILQPSVSHASIW